MLTMSTTVQVGRSIDRREGETSDMSPMSIPSYVPTGKFRFVPASVADLEKYRQGITNRTENSQELFLLAVRIYRGWIPYNKTIKFIMLDVR